jgi:hypothetical protein
MLASEVGKLTEFRRGQNSDPLWREAGTKNGTLKHHGTFPVHSVPINWENFLSPWMRDKSKHSICNVWRQGRAKLERLPPQSKTKRPEALKPQGVEKRTRVDV